MKSLLPFFSIVFSLFLFGFDLSHHEQMLLVLVDEWSSNEGSLWLFERRGGNQPWKQYKNPLKVSVASKGLAWGRGLHPTKKLVGPIKREADLRSPAGIFRLGPILGQQKKESVDDFHMPYIHIRPSIVAVDDISSPFYNQIVDSKNVACNWKSALNLNGYPYFKWGVIIEYNCHPSIPKEGSCIFICTSCEAFYNEQVAGTAISEKDLLPIMHWLRQSAMPVIVQLPVKEYDKYREKWHLPEVEWKG